MAKAKKAAKKSSPKKKAVKVKAGKAKVAAMKPKMKAKLKAVAKKPKAKAKPLKKAVLKGKKALKAKPVPKGKALAKAPKAAKVKAVKEARVTPEVVIEPPAPPEDVVLTDAEGRRYCRVKDCDQLAMVDSYCRYHYLLYWKKIQIRKKILTEGKLERYIEELTARYPDKYLEMLRKDLRSEKEFLAAIQELEIDESANDGDFEDESDNYIEEVRGMSEPASTRTDDDY